MRVDIEKTRRKEDERVLISCVEVTQDIEDIRNYAVNRGTGLLGLTDQNHIERFLLENVYYFEAIDEKVFAYTVEKVYEIKGRLYEVEKTYSAHRFVRCSKSVVVNLMLIASISPALNGRFFAHMKNGEKLIISRQYAPFLR
jgi:DNA-binding LytR/AlgR family response regulator